MRINVLMPSRRPDKMLRAMRAYIASASGAHDLVFSIAIDDDDAAMHDMLATKAGGSDPSVRSIWNVSAAFGGSCCVLAHSGPRVGKVGAYNRAISILPMAGLDAEFVVVASDDLLPIAADWDTHIAREMDSTWPGLDGAIFFPAQEPPVLMTMPVIGRNLLPWLNGAYESCYRNEWCDNELHNALVRRGRLAFSPLRLFRHEHPALGLGTTDALYRENSADTSGDMKTYVERSARGFGWPEVKLSILIPTMPHRRGMLRSLMAELARQLAGLDVQRARTVETRILPNDGSESIGIVRNKLLAQAAGEYIAFIDDDDTVSDGYVAQILQAIEADPKPDAVGFYVQHHINGVPDTTYSMSRDFDVPTWNGRPINHLAATRRELALRAGFPDLRGAEDKWYSEKLLPLLGHCTTIRRVLYAYRDGRLKPRSDDHYFRLARCAGSGGCVPAEMVGKVPGAR